MRGFLRIERPALKVKGHRQIESNGVPEGDAKRFPVMETDIYVPSVGGPSAIIETKCVAEPFVGAGRTRADSLRSDHLYQLFAYLTNHARSSPAEPPPLGVLLRGEWQRRYNDDYRNRNPAMPFDETAGILREKGLGSHEQRAR